MYYITSLAPTFAELPASIIANHTGLSLALLNSRELARYQGSVTTENVIANLNSCLNPGSGYTINIEAYVRHAANFRSDVIQSTMSQIGIERTSTRIRRIPVFFSYLKTQYPDRDLAVLTEAEFNKVDAYQLLDDLADRRNAVAHGNSLGLLSPAILLQFVEYCEVYGKALCEIVMQECIPFQASYLAKWIGKPIKVVDNHIVCSKLCDVFVAVGDTLIAKSPKGEYFAGEIQSLQVDGKPLDFVPSQADVDVGMRVLFHAKESQEFYVLYDKAPWLARVNAKDKYSLMEDGELRAAFSSGPVNTGRSHRTGSS